MPAGTVERLTFESAVLKGNPLRDPHVRDIPVYLPADYYKEATRRYPVIYYLTGFTGRGAMCLNDKAWGETLPQRLDRLIASRKLVPSIVVMPDCFTALGGSQYLNSPATGRYEDHLVKELVPFIDRRYRTLARPGSRAVMGKSSGGYGALVQAMKHPDVFGISACHSGDMYFELCYKPDFPKHLARIARHGGTAGFLKKWLSPLSEERRKALMNHEILNTIAMASCYSPRPGRRPPFELPFDETTGELKEKVWKEWRTHDPVYMLDRLSRNLKKLRLLYLDCGIGDEFNLQFGARIFTRKLKRLGIRHVHEEFDDGHMGISYREDRSLPLISKAFQLS